MRFIPAFGAVAAVLVGGWFIRGRLSLPRRLSAAGDEPARRREPRSTQFRRRVGGVAVLLTVGIVVDPFVPVVVGLSIAVWPTMRRLVEARQRRALIVAAVPDAIELLILMIRAGLTPHQAVRASVASAPGPIRRGFAEVERRLERGQPLGDALRGLPDVLGPALDPIADTLAIAERYGTPIGDALTQLSNEVRQQRRRLAEADARKLPVRLSFPLVFCTLPSFVLVAIAPAVMAALSSLGDSTW